MPHLPPCKLFWANAGGRWHAWLGNPWAPLPGPLSSEEHRARTFLRSASWRGPAESGHGQSPGAELRGAGSVPDLPGWVGVEARGTGPPGEADGGGTPVLTDSLRDSRHHTTSTVQGFWLSQRGIWENEVPECLMTDMGAEHRSVHMCVCVCMSE